MDFFFSQFWKAGSIADMTCSLILVVTSKMFYSLQNTSCNIVSGGCTCTKTWEYKGFMYKVYDRWGKSERVFPIWECNTLLPVWCWLIYKWNGNQNRVTSKDPSKLEYSLLKIFANCTSVFLNMNHCDDIIPFGSVIENKSQTKRTHD